MNITLLKKIESSRCGFLATILGTEGHTYKKKGEKALYEVDEPLPVCGNIVTSCADQEILTRGKEAFREKKPGRVRIDTSDPSDIVFGYGTFCGGTLEVLLEPLFEDQKRVYREVIAFLEKAEYPPRRENRYLIHDLETGTLTLSSESPQADEHILIETIDPPVNLYIFGATPLARQIVEYLARMEFRIHVIDWRESYLETFERFDQIRLYKEFEDFDERSMVLILSHRFERDRDILMQVLLKGCSYVGLLSSKTRRARIYQELTAEGISGSMLDSVSSPVGIDIHSRTDPEIAISIVAELIRSRNVDNSRKREDR